MVRSFWPCLAVIFAGLVVAVVAVFPRDSGRVEVPRTVTVTVPRIAKAQTRETPRSHTAFSALLASGGRADPEP